MAEKTPKEAAERFIDFLKETLSCISSHFVSAYQQSEKFYKIYYEPYAHLNGRGEKHYALSITQIFRTVQIPDGEPNGGWFKAKTQEYSYRLIEGAQENEIVAYHWHPNDPGVKFPHLHIQVPDLHRIHFPTSRVCLEDFVYLLMRDYEIVPKLSRAACKEILERNKKAFEKMATWKIHP